MAGQRTKLTRLALWLFGLAALSATASEPPIPVQQVEEPTSRATNQPASNDLRSIKIAMIGDSTMASYSKPPEDRPSLTGWGQVFELSFNDKVKVSNHAQSGRSSKSFLSEGRWEPVLREKPV